LLCQELYGCTASKGTLIRSERAGEHDGDLYLVGLSVNGIVGTGVNAIDRCPNARLVACKAFLELLRELLLQAGQERTLDSIQIDLCHCVNCLWIDPAGEGSVILDADAIATTRPIKSIGGNIACCTRGDSDNRHVEPIILLARRNLCVLDRLELDPIRGRERCLRGNKSRIIVIIDQFNAAA